MKMSETTKTNIISVLVGFGFWLLGEIVIHQVIAPEAQTFVRIALLAIAAVMSIGIAETIRGYQEDRDERYK